MILNHSKTIRSVIFPYCAFLLWYLEHSRDITLLIVLLCMCFGDHLVQAISLLSTLSLDKLIIIIIIIIIL